MNCRGSTRLTLNAPVHDGRERAPVTTRPPILLELGPDSDVAVRESDDGALRCVACSLRYGEGDFIAPARREMVRHLLLHQEEGGRVPQNAIERLAGTV